VIPGILLVVIHGVNQRIPKGLALREAGELKEGFFKLWRFRLSPRKEFVEDTALIYYPFYLIPYQITWGRAPFAPGMMIDARFREFSVLAGIPPRSRIETNDLVIQPTVDEYSAKRHAETKLREAVQRKRAREMSKKKGKELTSYEIEELELVYWPFWAIQVQDMWKNYRFVGVDAVLNFRGFNVSFTRFFSGPLYSLVSKGFEQGLPSSAEKAPVQGE